ncbi:MAG: hypothetical protein QOH28_1316 [Actinomycetota bacterium]|nr:hypothetical protein [Actinomycetota bacterium]
MIDDATVETRLRRTFDAVARRAVTSGMPAALVEETPRPGHRPPSRRRTRTMLVGTVALAAAAALVVGLLNVSGGSHRVEVKAPVAQTPESWDCAGGKGRYAIASRLKTVKTQVKTMYGDAGDVRLLDRASCVVVADPTRYTMTWSSANPKIVTVYIDCHGLVDSETARCARGEHSGFHAVGVGKTTVHVVAKERGRDAVVGELDIPVTVTPEPPPSMSPCVDPRNLGSVHCPIFPSTSVPHPS